MYTINYSDLSTAEAWEQLVDQYNRETKRKLRIEKVKEIATVVALVAVGTVIVVAVNVLDQSLKS